MSYYFAKATDAPLLPCSVIVQDLGAGWAEVAAIDPIASMQAVQNPSLGQVAVEVQAKLKRVVEQV